MAKKTDTIEEVVPELPPEGSVNMCRGDVVVWVAPQDVVVFVDAGYAIIN